MDSIKNFFKNTPPSKFIYPGILLLCAVIILVIFFLSTGFLTQQINRIFTIDTTSNTFSIDLADYKLVAHTLGLPQDISSGSQAAAPAPITASTTPAVVEIQKAATSTPALDKHAITIAVYNATSVSGLAGKTKDKLVVAGFIVTKTGNAKTQATSTIVLKESAMAYLPLLTEALGTTFAGVAVTTAAANASYDAIITVGGK